MLHYSYNLNWFHPKTVTMFNSVLETEVLLGKYFITSERMARDMPKRYTVRVVGDCCKVSNYSEFQEFDTLYDALKSLTEVTSLILQEGDVVPPSIDIEV